jgi:short-subunit dehydrogenase
MMQRITLPAAVAGVLGGMALLRAAIRGQGYDFNGKTVLITGGSRGLGLELARQFAKAGAQLSLLARDVDELERARAELDARGAEVAVFPCDIGSRAEVDDAVARTLHRFGAIDVLVNNAGRIDVGPLETMTVEDFEASMRVHFYGPLYALFAALPELRSRRGRVVNITSIGGKVSVPHLVPYSASKFALVGLSEGLRAELEQEGISVTTVCPWLMRTGSPRNAQFKGRHRKEYSWFALGDSLPVMSMSSTRAARKIVDACRRGKAEVFLGWQALAAAKVSGLFPGLTSSVMALVNRILPSAGGIGRHRVSGAESTGLLPSWLTSLDARAARRNNEIH